MARRGARSRWTALLVTAAIATSACSVILGVDGDYFVDESGAGEGGPGADGGPDALANDGGSDSAGEAGCPLCTDAGGTCPTATVCNFACSGGCSNRAVQCPPGIDCTIQCTGAGCDKLRCAGGRSCTIDCQGTTSCDGVACESDTCDIKCSGKDSCGGSPTILCDAGVCKVACTGEASCKAGIGAQGSTYCGIACTGLGSCNAGGIRTSCTSADASVTCGPATDACKDGKPSCHGAYCALQCLGTVGSVCGQGYCCDATDCNVVAPGRTGSCP